MLKTTPHDRKTRNSSLGISASWVSWRTETKMTSWGSRRRVCRYRTYAMRVLRFQRSIPVGWLLGRYLQCVHSCEDTHNSLHSFFFFFLHRESYRHVFFTWCIVVSEKRCCPSSPFPRLQPAAVPSLLARAIAENSFGEYSVLRAGQATNVTKWVMQDSLHVWVCIYIIYIYKQRGKTISPLRSYDCKKERRVACYRSSQQTIPKTLKSRLNKRELLYKSVHHNANQAHTCQKMLSEKAALLFFTLLTEPKKGIKEGYKYLCNAKATSALRKSPYRPHLNSIL